MNFKYSLIDQDGQVGYTAYQQNGINLIGMYNISGPSASLIATFNNNGRSITLSRLCLTDEYLLSFSSSSTTVYYFSLLNRILVGSFSLTDLPNTMTFLSSRKWVIYTSTNGAIKYFDSSLTSPMASIMATTTIASGLLATLYISVSPL